MSDIRAFITIEIPSEIHAQLDKITQDLQSQTKARTIHWVPGKNIHLTLKFLGEVSSTNLGILTKILTNEAVKHPHFEIDVDGLGAFPSIQRPRVIWIGIEAPPRLITLQKGIEAETLRLGYAPDEREFSPHLTLARISHNASQDEIRHLSDVLANYQVGSLGTFKVDTVKLFKSDLLPGGTIYTPLFTISLKADDHPINV